MEAEALRVRALAGLLSLGLAGLVWLRWPRAEPPVVLVELAGEGLPVGFYALPAGSDLSALRSLAGLPSGDALGPAAPGQRLSREADGRWVIGWSEAAPTLGGRLDLNRCSAEALAALPGLGPQKAADIVADREARGPFSRIEELDRVRGIGPSTVDRLRPYLSVPP